MLKSKIIIVFMIISLLFLASCKKDQPKAPDKVDLTFRFKPGQKIDYVLELNHTKVKQGTLEAGWNDLKIKSQVGEYILYYWNDEHYVHLLKQENWDSSINTTITKELPLTEKKAEVDVRLDKSLEKEKEQTINLIFNGSAKKLSYCLYRTVGIVYAEPLKDESICHLGIWRNNTPFGNLSKPQYYCDKVITNCLRVFGSLCVNDRYFTDLETDVDDCYFLGGTLNDELLSIPLNVKTMDYFDDSDYIKVYAFDMDLSEESRILGKEWGYAVNKIIKGEELR